MCVDCGYLHIINRSIMCVDTYYRPTVYVDGYIYIYIYILCMPIVGYIIIIECKGEHLTINN